MESKNHHPALGHRLTFGQRAADNLSGFAGSWGFILSFLAFVVVWMIINVMMIIYRWDPYPFILLNLILSCLAAIQAPVILMSQNREAQRDRLHMQYDYQVNVKAEREIRDMQRDLEEIKKLIRNKH